MPLVWLRGYYTDNFVLAHGFIRNKDGVITSFDVPNGVYGAFAIGINGSGAVTGYYVDENGAQRGFVRDKAGVVTTFVPAEDASSTVPVSINSSGVVTGYYIDSSEFIAHGFIRSSDGVVRVFAVPAGSVWHLSD